MDINNIALDAYSPPSKLSWRDQAFKISVLTNVSKLCDLFVLNFFFHKPWFSKLFLFYFVLLYLTSTVITSTLRIPPLLAFDSFSSHLSSTMALEHFAYCFGCCWRISQSFDECLRKLVECVVLAILETVGLRLCHVEWTRELEGGRTSAIESP